MAIGRGLTRRIRRTTESSGTVSRGGTVKYAPGTIDRSMISLPTALISTTNVQALTAPDIRSISSSSADSVNSSNDSDFSTIDRSFLSHASDDSPAESPGPETPITPPTEAKDFFQSKQNIPTPSLEAPVIPERAPSHSKKAHVELSRKLSMQRMSPPPTSIDHPKAHSSATTSVVASEPFARELAKVSEVAEEFGASYALLDDEEQLMVSKGLCKFGVEDYIDEIAELYGGIFEDRLGRVANPWI